MSWCLEPSVDAGCCQSWSYSLEQTDRTVTAKLSAQTKKKSVSQSGKWKGADKTVQLEMCHGLGDEDGSYGGADEQESFVMASTIIGEREAVAVELNMNQVDTCLKSLV